MNEPLPADPGAAGPGIPRIGDLAPDFQALTTEGEIEFSKWQGDSWVVLFSHPADFTPVCTTELAEFARRSKDFAARNVKLIGASVDSIHAHVAWIENIRERLGVEIDYPLVADLDMGVAYKYGMIHARTSNTAAVRGLFVIAPNRTVQALIYYPLSVGRNVDEVLRLVDGLQTSATHACSTPVNWKPGEPVLVPPPTTRDDVKARSDQAHDDVAFYLAYRDL